ncbi:MAG: nuclear transport factor 2 family protein [Bacteroidota bacterium]
MSYLDKIKDLYTKMAQGQVMEAFDKYYHDDVVVKEVTGETRNGKAAQREALKKWQSSIKELHGGGHDFFTANEEENTTSVRSWVEATFQDGNRYKMTEVALQKWQGDQIIEEHFYYNAPGM